MSSSHPWCFYYIQGEEGETPQEPNAFPLLPTSSTTTPTALTLKHFLASFPLGKAHTHTTTTPSYHTRFKVKDERFGFAWQDIQDVNAPLPVYNGVVYAKLLRLDNPPQRGSRLRRKPLSSSSSSSFSSSTGQRQGSSNNSNSNAARPRGGSYSSSPSSSNVYGGTPPTQVAPPSAAPVQQVRAPSPRQAPSPPPPQQQQQQPPQPQRNTPPPPSPKHHQQQAPPPKPTPTHTHADDLDSFLYGGGGSTSNGNSNSNGHSTHTPTRPIPPPPPPTTTTRASSAPSPSPPPPRPPTHTPPPPTKPMSGLDIDDDDDYHPPASTHTHTHTDTTTTPPHPPPNATQEELFFNQPTTSKQAEAQKEEAATDALRTKLSPKLTEWATDAHTRTPRNIRTLLSTMHNVVWEGCSWKPVFLGDLMAPDRVKFHYRKAMLVLHPDKNVNGTAEQRFISEKIFTSVNEAYTVFAAQELK